MEEKKKSNNWVKQLSDAINMVTSLAAAVALCVLGGYFLDNKLGTDPWLKLAGSVLGVATGFKMMWDRIKK
jgi:F0F1-type ATP synthase assembly protein I